jgi:ferric-dicitrate binding protein FerR (iron transport regulator)
MGQRALAALAELARRSVGPPTAEQLDQGARALHAHIAVARVRRTRLVRWSGAMVAMLVVTAGALWVSRTRPPPAEPPTLAYQIEGGSVVEGGYLRESGHAGIRLAFAEGTQFALLPGSRGRLRTADSAGVRIAIEQGTATFQVVPSGERSWLVDVGPFLVTVKGTDFWVSWDAKSERFELRLRRGRVTVSGPASGGDLTLQAGQRLVVSLPKAETLITEQTPEEAWAETNALASPAAHASSERPLPSPAGRP